MLGARLPAPVPSAWKILLVLKGIALLLLSGCRTDRELPPAGNGPGGDPDRGRAAFARYGCQSCHIIPGVHDQGGLVGPPLDHWAQRRYIAGRLLNNEQNLVSWLMAPQAIIPGSAMPDMGVTWGAAQDMAAYLFTLTRSR